MTKTGSDRESKPPTIRVGCAGWNISRESAARFPAAGSHLERYSQALPAVEINSSFYRPHRRSTYARWAATVPARFRFSVKVPKAITHELRLQGASEPLRKFLGEVEGLGESLEVLLVQLPPSLTFQAAAARAFFREARGRTSAVLACEPRHRSWFTADADALLAGEGIARVAADPAVVPAASLPGGSRSLAYFRLHGSPRVYYSSYDPGFLADLAGRLQSQVKESTVWCIFDNTAAQAATANAFELMSLVQGTAGARG